MARSLRETIGLVVAFAAACGGRIADDGVDGGAPSAAVPPPEEDRCPYTFEVRGFDLTLSGDQACAIATGAPACFSSYCLPTKAACAEACGDPAVNACTLPLDYLKAVRLARGSDASVLCPAASSLPFHCGVTENRGTKKNGCPIEGRRPRGLAAPVAAGDPDVGDYFAECEHLEAASVVAFRELAEDLARLGAPASLVEACLEAMRDEERHAGAMGVLRARFGGTKRSVVVVRREAGTTFDLARANAVEGVVRETFGAAVALFRAEHAADPAVRGALRAIAEDECRHAELSRRVADHLAGLLDDADRERLARAERAALAGLAASFAHDPPPALALIAGLPSACEARALLAGLDRELWSARAA